MTYSKRSLDLAEKLRQKAISNLEAGEHTRMHQLRKILMSEKVSSDKIEKILRRMQKHW